MADLLFVNIDHPSQSSNLKARKLVRSHISRRQHERKRNALEQALEQERARLEKLERSEDSSVGTSQCDDSRLTLGVNGIIQSAGTSGSKTDSIVTTDGSLAACEPGLRHAGLTGSRASPHDSKDTPPSRNSGNLMPSYTSHTGSHAKPMDDPALHAFVLSRPHSIRTDSTVCDPNRDFKEESSSSWKRAAENRDEEKEEEAEQAGPGSVYSNLTAKPKLRSVAGSVPARDPITSVAAPQIHHSLNDPVDELQAFAKNLAINVPLLLQHFYKVVTTMATPSEPAQNLPPGYMVSLWDTSSRSDPAARAAILFSAAANFRLTQAEPFPHSLLCVLRGYALSSIRAALEDPRRVVGDAMLVAVTTVAQTELVCGWEEEHRVHQRGLAQIRKLRGPNVVRDFEVSLSLIDGMTAEEIMKWTRFAVEE